ncbi:diacylglycerol kinase family protein (plasmid) [Tistrella mobilis]|uniref:diacylglycerol/lipid kinase family protein n=1 Tax=Tistrella mobilis TaxID=171437 RepID=UPI0035581E22
MADASFALPVIHNPAAGGGRWPVARLGAQLEAQGLAAAPLIHAKDPDLGPRLAAAAAGRRPEAVPVLVAGGDGTVARLLRALPDRRMPVAILATGSANNIARSFGLHLPDPDDQSGDRVDLATRVLAGIACPWHAGRVQMDTTAPRLFFESVGFGAIAAAMDGGGKDLHGLPKILAGRAALAEALAAGRPQRCRLTLGDRVVALRSLLVEIPCLPWTGPRLLIAPGLSPGGRQVCAVTLPARHLAAARAWLADPEMPVHALSPLTAPHIVLDGLSGPVRIDDARLTEDAAGRPFAFDRDPDPFRILTDPDI